jgi:Sec-independent protein translocase protein TatA
VGVSRLRELSGSATSRLRRFREALSDALHEVSRVEKRHKRRFEWSIDGEDLVHVVRESGN